MSQASNRSATQAHHAVYHNRRELAAISLESQQKPGDAAFYRGIARKLAEAHGRAKKERGPGSA